MKTKNKAVEITTAIVGGIFTVVHIIAAVYCIMGLADPNLWQLQGPGSSAMASIIVVFIELLGKAIGVIFAVFIIGVALLLIVAEILPLFFKSTKALRIISIVISCLLADIVFLEVILILNNAASLFREGNYPSAILACAFMLLGIAWFALSVTKAVIYKKKQNPPAGG